MQDRGDIQIVNGFRAFAESLVQNLVDSIRRRRRLFARGPWDSLYLSSVIPWKPHFWIARVTVAGEVKVFSAILVIESNGILVSFWLIKSITQRSDSDKDWYTVLLIWMIMTTFLSSYFSKSIFILTWICENIIWKWKKCWK